LHRARRNDQGGWQVSDNDALHALLRLQKRLIGRGSGASCCTDVKIVRIREDFKTIKDTLANLAAERDEARRMYCGRVSRDVQPDAFDIAKNHGWNCFPQEDDK
jgi:hypothetical protein